MHKDKKFEKLSSSLVENLSNNPQEKPKKPKKSKATTIIVSILAICIFFGSAFLARYVSTKQTEPDQIKAPIAVEQPGEKENLEAEEPVQKLYTKFTKPAFAAYAEIKSLVKPSTNETKAIYADIENIKDFAEIAKIELTSEQISALEEQNFYLSENNIISGQSSYKNSDDFTDTYKGFTGSASPYLRNQTNTLYISSDVALHLYHILIDRSFQKIEETKFHPTMFNISKALFKDSITKYNTETNPIVKDSYKRLSAYYLIPTLILESGDSTKTNRLSSADFDTYALYLEALSDLEKSAGKENLNFLLTDKSYDGIAISDEIYEIASTELKFISEAKEATSSPLFTPPLRRTLVNDYTQFTPRSHYTKNKTLKSYFVAMMWYGRMGFTLNSPELTRDALTITNQINTLKVGDDNLKKLWSDIMATIDFFVGETDDLTAYQYSSLVESVYQNNLSSKNLSDETLMKNFVNSAIETLPTPKIISEAIAEFDDLENRNEFLAKTMQFRFMGQRFTPDAYILGSLTQGRGAPDPETGQNLPSMPTALMPISLLNPDNSVVKSELNNWISENAPDSDKVIEKFYNKLDAEFKALPESTWTQNIYWSWLNTYKTLLSKYEKGYPFFMKSEAWQKKNLGTVLGSYAELKHDTLLYAKQSYAELGGGGNNPDEIPPVPKGYVEPDLTFWTRLLALTEMTETGLRNRGFFPEEFKYKFQDFKESTEFFRNIVEQELENKVISEEDFERLRKVSKEFEKVTNALPGKELTKKEKRAGIIADIHTDAVDQKILYEATAKPFIIYVAVSDVNGTRLTRGAVFNHREFTGGLEKRLADEDWQERVYESEEELPEMHPWQKDLIK